MKSLFTTIVLALVLGVSSAFAGGPSWNWINPDSPSVAGAQLSRPMTSTRIGDFTYHGDGSYSRQVTNTMAQNSDGSTTTRIGNTYSNSSGLTSTRIGNTIYHNDGSHSVIMGNQIFYYPNR